MLLYSLDVAEGAQRRGHGRDLVSGFVEHASAIGCTEVWVLTDDDNDAAVGHLRLGGRHERSGPVGHVRMDARTGTALRAGVVTCPACSTDSERSSIRLPTWRRPKRGSATSSASGRTSTSRSTSGSTSGLRARPPPRGDDGSGDGPLTYWGVADADAAYAALLAKGATEHVPVSEVGDGIKTGDRARPRRQRSSASSTTRTSRCRPDRRGPAGT